MGDKSPKAKERAQKQKATAKQQQDLSAKNRQAAQNEAAEKPKEVTP